MLNQIYHLVKQKHQLIFILLTIAYFILGIYLMQVTSVTSDEPAQFGSAYAYIQGQGFNREHPLLLKLINAAVIRIFFSKYNDSVPAPQTLDDLDVRLEPYNIGYQFFMSDEYNFYTVLLASRLVYLIFNSMLLFWLYLYTYRFKLINPFISLAFGILFVFSPSFYSQSFVIKNDVPPSICAVLTILSIAVLVSHVTKSSKRELACHFLSTTFFLFCAINVKFSQLVLFPIVVLAYGITIFYLFKTQRKELAVRFSWFSAASLLVQPILIYLMYRIAFRSMPQQSVFDNIGRYLKGMRSIMDAKNSVQKPFLDGSFVEITYQEYILKYIFWFKENPALFLIAIVIISNLILITIKNRHSLKELLTKRNFRQYLPVIGLVALLSACPLMYICLAKDSRFIIGYRHFYPVLIFIYLLLASLTVTFTTKTKQIILGCCFVIYIFFGILAIPQSLSYVNPLWTKEKWLLTNDSTLNWGQENQQAAAYLIDNKLLPEKNDKALIFNTFNVPINIPEYLSVLSKQKNYPLDMSTYYGDRFQPEEMEIAKLPHKYLLIDSSIKQNILDKTKTNQIAAKNWEFLQENKPIYSHNGIIWIYQLNSF